MSIKKIVGHFIAESINVSGYVLEDGEVFLTLKGEPLNREGFERKTLSILGFTVTHEKIAEYNHVYDNAANEYGFRVKEQVGDVIEEEVVSEEVVEKEVEPVLEEKPTRRRSTRGKPPVKPAPKKN